MDGRYLMQVLVAVGKACKPNSPYPQRAWTRVYPLYGIPEFGDALGALVRYGYLDRAGNRVKPSVKGYQSIYAWKAWRKVLRARPILWTREVWDVGTAQEECILIPDGKDAVNAPRRPDAGNRRGSARPSRQIDHSLRLELMKTKTMKGTLAHAVVTGEVASDLMYRVAPCDTLPRC